MKLRISAMAAAVALSIAGMGAAHAATYTNIYAFGDSITDNGSFSAATNSSTSTKVFWTDVVARDFGRQMTSAWNGGAGAESNVMAGTPNATGNNFALGGAEAVMNNSMVGKQDTQGQINAFLARNGGRADPNALHLFWIGGNDLATASFTAVGSGLPAGIADAQSAGTAAANQIKQLIAAGAKNVVVLNAPDVSVTPRVIKLIGLVPTLPQIASTLSGEFNNALKAGLQGQKNVLMIDSASLLNTLVASPATYGFNPAKSTTSLVDDGFCPNIDIPNCLNTPSAGYIFSNEFHPTEATHQTLGNYVLSLMQAVGAAEAGMGITDLAGAVPLGRSGAEWRTIDSRMRAFQNYSLPVGTRFFAAGDFADVKTDSADGSRAADGRTLTGSVGLESSINANTLVGASLGYEDASLDLAHDGGDLDYNELMLTGFASYKMGPWYINGLASIGKLEYDTKRNIGSGFGSEKASFDGDHYGAKVQLGYQFVSNGLVHGPFIGTDYEEVKIDSFSEGASLTGIAVDDQTLRQAHYRIGYELAGETVIAGRQYRPYAVVSYDNQYLEDKRTRRAGLASTGMMFESTVESDTGGFTRIGAGFSTRIGESSELAVGISTTLDNPNGNKDTALNVVWSLAL